jgi:hypothetical protein
VVDFDLDRREVVLREGRLQYDTLVVAAGASNYYSGNDDWSRVAPGLKSLEDATEMRRRVLLAFEKAEGETDRHKRESLLTFVVVGGGPTGVELASALAELARDTLRRDFRSIDQTPRTGSVGLELPDVESQRASDHLSTSLEAHAGRLEDGSVWPRGSGLSPKTPGGSGYSAGVIFVVGLTVARYPALHMCRVTA